jgi:hypothetical protein
MDHGNSEESKHLSPDTTGLSHVQRLINSEEDLRGSEPQLRLAGNAILVTPKAYKLLFALGHQLSRVLDRKT